MLTNTEAVLVDGRETWTDEYRFRRADGTYATLVDRAYVVRDAEDRPLRMLGTVQDVTKRKEAEREIRELNEPLERRVEEGTAELKASEERYGLVVEGSNDGIFDWDLLDGTIFWNDRLFEIVGLSRQSFTPTLDAFLELVHPGDREKVSEGITAHLERNEEFEVEFRMHHAGGEYRTCISRGKAQRDEAEDGFAALEMLRAAAREDAPYGLAVLDMQMPEMDGMDLAQRVSGDPAIADLRVILLTSIGQRGDGDEARRAGIEAYLTKPVRQSALDEVLGRWVSREDGAVPDDGAPGAPETPAGNGSVLDPEVLANLRDLGDAELLAELAGMFFDDASSRLEELREAVGAGDAAGVERVAHTLKGSSGNMGATRISAICSELQDVGAPGNLARARELFGGLEEEFGRVRPALEAEVEGGP